MTNSVLIRKLVSQANLTSRAFGGVKISRLPLPSSGVLVLLLMYLMVLREAETRSPVAQIAFVRYLTTSAAFLVLIGVLVSLTRGALYTRDAGRRTWLPWIGLVLFTNAGYILAVDFNVEPSTFPSLSSIVVIAAAIIAFLMVLLVSFRAPIKTISLDVHIVGIILSFAVIAQGAIIFDYPLDPRRSDMLPVIVEGGKAFLLGVNPYGSTYFEGISNTSLTYLPLLWLSHLPLVAFGLDPRWLGVILWPATIALLMKAGDDLSMNARRPLLYTLAAAPVVIPRLGVHTLPYLLLLVAFLYVLRKEKWWTSTIILGLSLATRHTAVLLLPFYWILVWRRHSFSLAAVYLVTVSIIAFVFIAPFLFRDVNAFGSSIWDIMFHISDFKTHLTSVDGFNVSLFFLQVGLLPLLFPTQMILQALLFLCAFFNLRTISGYPIFAACSYSLFLSTNIISMNYMWLPVLLILSFAVFTSPIAPPVNHRALS